MIVKQIVNSEQTDGHTRRQSLVQRQTTMVFCTWSRPTKKGMASTSL